MNLIKLLEISECLNVDKIVLIKARRYKTFCAIYPYGHKKLKCLFFLFFWLCGFWILTVSIDLDRSDQNIESLKRLYSVCWGGNEWPRRPLGVNYSAEACGHCVKVGLVVLLLKRELDSLTECLRWWWTGWPPLLVTVWVIPEDLGNFSPKKGEKSWGAKIRTPFSVEFLQ